MWLWFRPITPKRTGLSRGATIDRVYHDAPARARCSSTGTSPRVAGHSACLLRILIELRWRCVPLAEPTDRVAKGVEREQVGAARCRAVEHGLHVLEGQRPADAVEQLVQNPLGARLRRQGAGEAQIAAITGQLAGEYAIERNAHLVVSRVDSRH